MSIFLWMLGAVCGGILILNNIVRTALRSKQITFIETLLVHFAVILPVVGLILDNRNNPNFDTLEQLLLLMIIPLLITGIGLTIVEAFRPQGFRQSRGLLSVGMAAILLIATFGFNVVAFNAELSAPAARIPTPVNALNVGLDPCDQTTLVTEAFQNFLGLVTETTGLDEVELGEVIARDGTISFAQLVEQAGNDPAILTQGLSDYFRTFVQDLTANECIPPIAGAVILSQLNTQIPRIVESDFNTVIALINSGFGFTGNANQGEPTPNATALQATREQLAAGLATVAASTNTPTPTQTPTITPSATPTVTRTAFPTFTLTPTRERFVTPTPSPSPTLPNPCLATANFNVNLRAQPNLESDVVLTIPFESTLVIYGPNADKTWWFGEYEGQAGWVSTEFIRLTRACDALPVRNP